jgi:hypothetical protein
MIVAETAWCVIAVSVGCYIINRMLANVVDDIYDVGIPYVIDAGHSGVENARIRWKRRQSSGITTEELSHATREDESIDTDRERSEEEQLAELRDTLQKAKHDLCSPSIDPETLRW